MYTDLKWKIPLILFAILGSAYLAYPLKDKIALGLDLQGGMHLVLEVQTEKAVEASLERIAGDIKREIAYHGDTLNVASRIEGLCKTYDKLILISGKVNENPKIGENFIVKPLGPQKLEGREMSVDVFCVAEK